MKVAVTVAAPLTVIVVDAEPELANEIKSDGFVLHAENVYPEPALAEIDCPATPALYHVETEGVVVPAPDGVAANVTWYCVWKLAVTVATEVGTV